MNPSKRFLVKYGVLILLMLGLYFGNVAVQSYWGRQALAASGLELRNLAEAQALAKTTSKPILLDISAIWCPNCRRLDKLVLSDPAVNKIIKENYIFSRLEYESEEGEQLLKKFNRTGFPNLMILDANGELIRPIEVTFDPLLFAKQLR